MTRSKTSNPRYTLQRLFDPASVAVVGASDNPGKLGYHVMTSLTRGGFRGRIAPVNPGAETIMGMPAYPSVTRFPELLDLAVIVLPADRVQAVFEECIRKGVGGIVLITAGFKEIDDPAGARRQAALAGLAEGARIPVIGPNTFGMVNLHRGLNASFTPEFSRLERGGITLVSQSGGISHLLAFMAMKQHVKIGKVVGLGNRLNVDFPDMIAYLVEDPETTVIALYLEGLDDPRPLLRAARTSGAQKPIIAYKTGLAAKGDAASRSHTGSLAGRHEIYDGALRQAGVLPVRSSEELLDLAQVLSVCPPPRGPRVAILSGQAGPGMAACDVCESGGLRMAAFAPRTQAVIDGFLPPMALRTNPVDMGPAWYDADAVGGIVEAAMDDDQVDALLLLMMFASANRESVPRLAPLLLKWGQKKPVLSCFNAPPGIWAQELRDLTRAGVLVDFPTPERAARTLAALWASAEIRLQRCR